MTTKNNKEWKARKSRHTRMIAIFRIFAYSVKRIIEKYIEVKSVRNPATNSDSASGKSKGTRDDSAKIDM
jgi:hypothetical protein